MSRCKIRATEPGTLDPQAFEEVMADVPGRLYRNLLNFFLDPCLLKYDISHVTACNCIRHREFLFSNRTIPNFMGPMALPYKITPMSFKDRNNLLIKPCAHYAKASTC